MRDEKVERPLGAWTRIKDNYGNIRYQWECPFCGSHENVVFPVGSNDEESAPTWLHEKSRCYHCDKDVDGKTDLRLYREGNCGYYGDGDFVWDGSWKGEKKVLTHRPLDVDRMGWYGQQNVPYDRPDIHLEVRVWTSGGQLIETDGGTRRKKRRVHAYSACLRFRYWTQMSVDIVRSKRVKTLRRVHEEVDAMDFTVQIAEMLQEYYRKSDATCVWKLEDNQWFPFKTAFGEFSGMELPVGQYVMWDERYGKYSRISRSEWGCGGWTLKELEKDTAVPPPPWNKDQEPVILQTDPAVVTKQLDSA